MAGEGRKRRGWLLALALGGGLVVGACGGGGGEDTSSSPAAPARSVARAPSKTVTAPPRTGPTPTTRTLTTPTQTTATSPEGGSEGGGGDEGGNRIPVALTIKPGGTVAPPTVSVPAFFRLEVTVRNADSRAHDVTISGPNVRHELHDVAPRSRASVGFQGGKPGAFRVLVDGALRARIVTGAQPGP